MAYKSYRPAFVDLEPGKFEGLADRYDWVELKYDGWFGKLVCSPSGWVVYSRTGKIKAKGYDPGPDKVFIGEYIRGTEWARKQGVLYGKFVAFAEVVSNRYVTVAQSALMNWEKYVFLANLIVPSPTFSVKQVERVWNEYVMGEREFEGLVFKSLDPSVPHGRMKRKVTMDYVIMDVEPSTSDKYKGWGARAIIGGLYVGGKLKRKVSISGLTDEQRREFLTKRNALLGRVFEASGKAVFKSGALRHPSFERIRDDKSREDCVWRV